MNYELFTPTRKSSTKKIYLVDMTKELNPYFSEMLQSAIHKYSQNGKKIVILTNKKGYSTGMLCQKCGHVPKCVHCSVSIGYHKMAGSDDIGLCHICKTQYSTPKKCPDCQSPQIKEFGLGVQKVAEYLEQNFKTSPLIVESETAKSPTKIKKLQMEFSTKKLFLGTGLLTTPPAGVQIDLVVFLQADFGLNIPDYMASESNFHFLYDAFCNYPNTNFLIQSFNSDHHSIRSACKMDKEGFWKLESEFRKAHAYPPHGDLCVLLYKNEIEESLFNKVDAVYKELLYLQQKYELNTDLEIYSTPPLIYKMYGKYRYHIILKGPQVRNFMDIVFTKLSLNKRGFKVDRQANSIV